MTALELARAGPPASETGPVLNQISRPDQRANNTKANDGLRSALDFGIVAEMADEAARFAGLLADAADAGDQRRVLANACLLSRAVRSALIEIRQLEGAS